MKALFLTAALILSSTSFAADATDVSKILDDNQCVPVHKKDGRLAVFECEGNLGQIAKSNIDVNLVSESDPSKPLTLDAPETQTH